MPTRDAAEIETACLTGQNHATLDLETASAVDGALFEVESISARWLSGARRGKPVRLGGGLWFRQERLAGLPLADWLKRLQLGGEIKTGHGLIREDVHWDPEARNYHGLGKTDGQGLHRDAGELLPGPSMDGVANGPLRPWLGRLHCPDKGFGRRLDTPALVVVDGDVRQGGCFMPGRNEVGLGCWERN